MAPASNPKEALLWALSDLDENSFKTLKFHLQDRTRHTGQGLARGELEGLGRVDLASRLVLMYGVLEAVNVVLEALKTMHLLELVDQLSPICLNDYRAVYREHARSLERQEDGVKDSYNQLILVSEPSSERPIGEQELDSVAVEALFDFDFGEKPNQGPAVVVLQGSAGTGKTTLARKMLLDWATGTLYPGQFDYVFNVSCREVALLQNNTLEELLAWCCGDSRAPVGEIQRQPERLLFILDGYDELQRPFAASLQRPGPSPTECMLRQLIRRKALPACSLLITTRPPAAQSLQSLLERPRLVRILGFSEDERKRYFNSYFTDKEQAQKAIDFVRRNEVLYKACQVPGICWVVCSWLKRQMEGGDRFSKTPSNSTDIFMAYVSTFLPPSDNEGCPELTRNRVLRGLCSLASEGMKHQRFLFEEADLRKRSLDGPSLAAFLSSQKYQEGLDTKMLYSFRHVSFQEFFHAMSYLVKEGQSQLGEGSLREVSRLLDEKDPAGEEEMTLSMQFLWDIAKKDSTLNFELMFCFKISPSIKQELKNFKEQMNCMKHKRSWELELSLSEHKLKQLMMSLQKPKVSLVVRQSRKNPQSKGSIAVKTKLSDGKAEEQKSPIAGKADRAGTQKAASNGKGEGRATQDKEDRGRRTGGTEMETLEPKGDGGVETRHKGKTE